MSKEKLTPWFKSTTKPVHVGIYETYMSWQKPLQGRTYYSYWNGKFWHNQWHSKDFAKRDKCIGIQNKHWRGLAQKP